MSYWIDTHTHLFEEEFDLDRSQCIDRAYQAGVRQLILPNIDTQSITRLQKTCYEINLKYPQMAFPAFGLHPTSVKANYEQDLKFIFDKIQHSQHSIIAIGEIGLDFYWDTTFKTEQKECFLKQCEWALELGLPIIIHSREAFADVFNILSSFRKKLRGVFHSFTGSEKDLELALSFDSFMIGINGVVSFKKNEDLRHLVSLIPLDRLLLETDAPYLAPTPKRGKRNESSFLIYTAAQIADIKKIELETLMKQTSKNAKELFSLPPIELNQVQKEL